MRLTTAVSLSIVLLLASALPLRAELCAVDAAPGATLLLPYFEVDLATPDGITTLVTIHNSAAETVLARVVLWTDLGYPTLGFEIYLTGFDVQAINLREVFAGRLPQTGPELSPMGRLSGPEVDFPSCDFGAPPPIPFEGLLADAHRGLPSPFLEGLCAGQDLGDSIARGYVTVDVVGDCTPLFPSDEGYFGAGGVARNDNVLLGDFLLFDAAGNRAFGDNLVSLEADAEAFEPGDATFYGRYVGDSANDAREPLPTLWSNRYLQGGGLGLAARSLVWRDTGAAPALFDCADEGPEWFPLDFNEITSFSEQEEATFYSELTFIAPPDPLFPAATQVGVGFRGYNFGWEILDLNPSPVRRLQSFVMEQVTARGDTAQGVTAQGVTAQGGASYLRPAMPLENGCDPGGCPFEAPPIGEICLGPDGGALEPGAPIAVAVRPEGCYSSTCTLVLRSACELLQQDGANPDEPAIVGLAAEALFCLSQLDDNGMCSADCNGGGQARCTFDAGLPEGDYLLRAGNLELGFAVPMDLPTGGLCIGDPFGP